MFRKQFMSFMSMAMIFTILLVACKKDESDVGIDVLPDKYQLESSIESFDVNAYTIPVDSIRTDSSSYCLLGSYTDPVFGESKASFVTQLVKSTSTTENEKVNAEDVVPDSLVLYFKYDTTKMHRYGIDEGLCNVDIFRIQIKTLNTSDEYFSNEEIDYSPDTITSFTFNQESIFATADEIADAEWEEAKQTALEKNPDVDLSTIKRPDPLQILRVKIPDELCKDIHSYLSDDITFVEAFKGFYFTPNESSDNNSIYLFDYLSSNTKAVLYYHTDTDTTTYTLGMDITSERFNLYEHHHNSQGFLANLDNPYEEEQPVSYIQGAAGLRTEIALPALDEYINDGKLWGVNKAELILPSAEINEEDLKKYPVPETLVLEYYSEAKTGIYKERTTGTDLLFGASYNDGNYIFDITTYVQGILKGNIPNNGLRVKVNGEKTNPSRVVLTNSDQTNKMQLKLTLTDLTQNK